MEQTTLEEAAKAFADAQKKETAARDHYATCVALLDQSITDSMNATKSRREAEQQLLKAACFGAKEPK